LNYFELTVTVNEASENTSLLQHSLNTIETPSSGWMLKLVNVFKMCCAKINPFTPWTEVTCIWKFWTLVKSPVVLLFNLTIPVVDEDKVNG
jgi:hypothetical protein